MVLRKLSSIFLACALVLSLSALAGCSTSSSNEPQESKTASEINAKDIEIVSKGFSVLESGEVNFAFIAKNPNSGYIGRNVSFTVQGFNPEGSLLISGGATLQEMYPNQDLAAAGTAYLPSGTGDLTELEVTPIMDVSQWEKTSLTQDEIDNMFSLEDVTETMDSGTASVEGTVTADFSSFSETSDGIININVHVMAILLDSNGDIVGGASSPSLVLIEETSQDGQEAGVDSAETDGDNADAGVTTSIVGNGSVAKFNIALDSEINYSSCDLIVVPGI